MVGVGSRGKGKGREGKGKRGREKGRDVLATHFENTPHDKAAFELSLPFCFPRLRVETLELGSHVFVCQ